MVTNLNYLFQNTITRFGTKELGVQMSVCSEKKSRYINTSNKYLSKFYYFLKLLYYLMLQVEALNHQFTGFLQHWNILSQSEAVSELQKKVICRHYTQSRTRLVYFTWTRMICIWYVVSGVFRSDHRVRAWGPEIWPSREGYWIVILKNKKIKIL